MESKPTTDLDALKTKLKATWSAGDFGEIAKYYTSEAEAFIRRRNLKRGEKVLDVACGTGNLALPAARAGAVVTGVDIAPNTARARWLPAWISPRTRSSRRVKTRGARVWRHSLTRAMRRL